MSMTKNLFVMMSQYDEPLNCVGRSANSFLLLSHIQEENAMINSRKNLILAANSGRAEYLKQIHN